ADQERLIELMEGVEDIPGIALSEGLSWDWESFPDYLDAIERRSHDIDIAAQLPHAALRVYVMGERAANLEIANSDEIAQMRQLTCEAVQAGALGFSSSRTLNHRTSKGDPTPSLKASEAELFGIAEGLNDAQAGVIEMISDFPDFHQEFETFRQMVQKSGRSMSISLAQSEQKPDGWRKILGKIEAASNEGLTMKAQVAPRPIGLLLGLQTTLCPFMGHPSYKEIASLPLAEKVRIMRDPAFREKLLSETRAEKYDRMKHILDGHYKMYPLSDPPDYEPDPSTSIKAIAEREGRRPEEIIYDLLLERDGEAMLYSTFANYANFNLDATREMLLHKDTLMGLGDGGAHVGTISDGSFPTYLMTHWGRDRTRGERLELPWLVKRQTSDNARAVGLYDRGLLKVGMKADVNVIDYENLRVRAPEIVYDLPAGGRRLLQRADGYLATLVNGEVVYQNGEHTGALPGKLIRGAQAAPAV
ncbi:MAG: amidohydrolase family protein, partial [Pseudomonadota bacterium]